MGDYGKRVNQSLNQPFYADGSDDEPFRSVAKAFRRHEAIQATSDEGTWLVRYDGKVYLADLSNGGVELTDSSSGGIA